MIYTRCISGKKFFEKSVKKRLTKGKKGDNIGTLSKKRESMTQKSHVKTFLKKLKKSVDKRRSMCYTIKAVARAGAKMDIEN